MPEPSNIPDRRIDVGDRVRLADVGDRRPDAVGTVIERDPYTDRDAIVRVGFENGHARWLDRARLVRLGEPRDRDDQALVLAEWEQSAEWMRRHHAA